MRTLLVLTLVLLLGVFAVSASAVPTSTHHQEAVTAMRASPPVAVAPAMNVIYSKEQSIMQEPAAAEHFTAGADQEVMDRTHAILGRYMNTEAKVTRRCTVSDPFFNVNAEPDQYIWQNRSPLRL
jgi:hypothetical protein